MFIVATNVQWTRYTHQYCSITVLQGDDDGIIIVIMTLHTYWTVFVVPMYDVGELGKKKTFIKNVFFMQNANRHWDEICSYYYYYVCSLVYSFIHL